MVSSDECACAPRLRRLRRENTFNKVVEEEATILQFMRPKVVYESNKNLY